MPGKQSDQSTICEWVDKNGFIKAKILADKIRKNKFLVIPSGITYDLIDLKTLISNISTNSLDKDNGLKRLKATEDRLEKI